MRVLHKRNLNSPDVLLRRALATGKRAGKYSKHIKSECCRCGAEEDEMHMLFLCQFSKAVWFSHPWYIKTELLASTYHTIPDMIQYLLSSNHPHISIVNLYTFLWCLWKVRNDHLFNRKNSKPEQVFAVYNAILQDTSLMKELQVQNSPRKDDHDQPEQLHQIGRAHV